MEQGFLRKTFNILGILLLSYTLLFFIYRILFHFIVFPKHEFGNLNPEINPNTPAFMFVFQQLLIVGFSISVLFFLLLLANIGIVIKRQISISPIYIIITLLGILFFFFFCSSDYGATWLLW